MNSKAKPLVLVDGSSYLYRAFHALPALANSKGQPTGAVYGVANMLRRLLADYDPDYMAVVFDAKGRTFRDEIFPEYKAHRPSMPSDLASQIAPLHEVIRAMGLPLLCIEGVEADDVIGTLAEKATAEGTEVLVSTGDKDMAQLVNDHVTLVNTMTDTVMDREGVIAKIGVPPERVIDYLALVGDSVDNIPGVPGVGPKTAVKWLAEYGSLDGVMAQAGSIKGKVGERLRENLHQLPLSRQLATIKCDVPLQLGPRDLARHEPDAEQLKSLYAELEFKNWLAELLKQEPLQAHGEGVERDYRAILDEASFEQLIERLERAELISVDLETTSLDYMEAEVVGISFSVEPGEGAYLPLAHRYPGAPEQLDRNRVLARLKPLLEDSDRAKVGQNLKYDMNVLGNHGITLRGIAHDSMLQSYVLNSTANRHDLDTLALKYLGRKAVAYEEVCGKGANQLCFDEVAIEEATRYAAEDAEVAIALHRTLWPQVSAEPDLTRLYRELEIPLVPVLSRMERAGVLVDVAMLRHHSRELAERMREVEQAAFDAAGEPFNLGSPKQIQAILFDRLGLPVRKKTPKGQPSTSEEVLQELAEEFELPRLILEHRGLAKLKSTYTDKLPEQVNPRTGRVHTSYHQAVAATGRLSSSDPNLQNIPVRNAEGRRIRQAFIAADGYRLVAADYSQIELRIMAHLSGDAGLLRAFASGEDIHRATAADVFGLAPEQVGSEERRRAKAINFGLIYGMSAFGLARQLGIDRAAAQSYIDLYFERYPGVRAYMEKTRSETKKRGYVETLFGRRLYVPDINASNTQRRQYAERTAINAPMQGSAADIIKRAMIAVDNWLQENGSGVQMVMQVHDELVFEIPAAALDETVAEIRRRMSGAAELAVPLVVDVGVGDNWDEAH